LKDKQTEDKIKKIITMLDSMGHQSPLEHVSFTFGIEGVSRSLLSQITRHRIASYSVQSQRYIDMENFKPVIPNDIINNKNCLDAFNECINEINSTYGYITDTLEYEYIKNGLDEKPAHKKAIENARAILPNATPTKMLVTMNARSLLHFFELRCCNRAQDEIRELADQMLILCKEVAPNVFKNAGAPCVRGKCTQGSMSCGHPRTK
jgi:thymidylate synthase (FAD)